jgi:cobyrinic acid a,c-diamide synthase
MMGREAVVATFRAAARGADVAIVEGVMGLYDGAAPDADDGSTAQIARWLDAPVLVVADASGMARSFAALAAGFCAFDRALRVAGLVANRVGSRGHAALLARALAHAGLPPLLGALLDEPTLAFPERHLGLATADQERVPEGLFAAWGARAAEGLDLDALVAIARAAPPISDAARPDAAPAAPAAPPAAKRCRIGVARDAAFHFYYADNLRRLEALGAELVYFSPIADRAPPDVDGLYLGGGYPELAAAALAANAGMLDGVRALAAAGRPVYAECGGLMYLTRAIRTLDGARHAMVGLVPGEAVMHPKRRALGYVEVETQAETILGAAGLRFRGHEFRYSELELDSGGDAERAGCDAVYSVRRRRGGATAAEGYRAGSVLASYVHAHWASNPRAAAGFVAACARGARSGWSAR